MALKLLKVSVNVELKGDPNDLDDLRDRLGEYLMVEIESGDLEFEVQDDESDELEGDE